MKFKDRRDAGQRLAAHLTAYANRDDVIVLALPRGGVPVAFEVARALGAPMDVFLVRKLGVPGHPELAMGAIAAGGVQVLSEDLIRELGIPRQLIEQVAVRERLELDRRDRLYRAGRPLPMLHGKTVILLDDGLATGASMEAAIAALRQHQPARIVVAAPVGAPETCARLRQLADEVVCAEVPQPFNAVGLWYDRFDQTTDEEVIELLRRAGDTSQPSTTRDVTIDTVRSRAHRLTDNAHDYDPLVEAIGDARLVLLGEASTRPGSRASCSLFATIRAWLGRWRRRASNAPLASSTFPKQNGRATTSRLDCRTNSTSSCTLTRPARSNRSSEPPDGKPASPLRRFRQGSKDR